MTVDSATVVDSVAAQANNAALFAVFNVGSGAGKAADVRTAIENGELAAILLKPVGGAAMLGLLLRGAQHASNSLRCACAVRMRVIVRP